MADNENQEEAHLLANENIQEQEERTDNMVSLQTALLTNSRQKTLQYSS
jgi:hypothetical protein